MKKIDATDAARVELMLGELRLPGIKTIWAEQSESAQLCAVCGCGIAILDRVVHMQIRIGSTTAHVFVCMDCGDYIHDTVNIE